ncbi:MAG: hypothetical protein IPO88_08280 [Nannocystis sp.]|uniref:hypothetical protein n=1 Tax=Nannocystis sp. TaxID=1962667 RepID=UPI002423014A|nr:hypothetical protein [Nannocystis sp.]MBK9753488.1 hypothetical protein [Nannocystis sp.]
MSEAPAPSPGTTKPMGPAAGMGPVAATGPRWSLVALSLVHGLVFAWAASVLPWQRWTLFAVTTAVLAALHLVTATLALAGPRPRRLAWRVTSLYALAYLAVHTFTALRAGVYIAVLYGGLGRGVAGGLGALWCVLVLFTVPLALWGIAATGGLRPRRGLGVAGALLVVFSAGLWRAAGAAAADPLPHPGDDPRALASDLQTTLSKLELPVPKARPKVHLWTRSPIQCDAAIDRPTLIVTYPVRDAQKPRSNKKTRDKTPRLRAMTRCVQAERAEDLLPALAATIADAAAPGPMKIDVLTATQPLASDSPGPLSLLLRPGLDGVCDGQRCLMPWQLVALGQFNTFTPLPFIEDLRFGSDPAALRRVLARRGDDEPALTLDGLTRITTDSFIVDHQGQVVHAPTMREPRDQLEPTDLSRASVAAERHVLAAQHEDGRFRYILQPFTGKVTWRGFAVPRQAGTTLTLCELGSPTGAVTRAARRSLAMMASLERPAGAVSGLVHDEPNRPPRRWASLGDTALPLIAFLSCRPRTGPEHDALIARLAGFLLAMQRPDGGFHPRFNLDTVAPIPGPDPMYAAGQVVFALTLLEQLLADEPNLPVMAGMPAPAELHAALDRAMSYFADHYWDHAYYSFFFLEENWHCLAARAALPIHRHPGYERFCLDYVEFKRRLILDAGAVRSDLVGAYGFGNVLPPHNTPTGGFGETLAAAMAIRAADGEARPEDAALMREVLAFLVEQQWTEANCFACTPDEVVPGGYSESIGSPDMRIDYTQHVWSAIGHGGRAIGLLRATPAPTAAPTSVAPLAAPTSVAPIAAPTSVAPLTAPTSVEPRGGA